VKRRKTNTRIVLEAREAARTSPRILKDPGSVEYAWQTLALLKTFYQSKQTSEDRWLRVLAEADELKIYTKVPPEKPYGSLDPMLLAEIGETALSATEKVRIRARNIAADPATQPAPTHGEIGRGRNRRTDSTSNKKRGTTMEYRLRKMKRDHPEVLEQIAAGKMTLPEAERAVGVDTRGRRVWLAVDVDDAAKSIIRRFDNGYAEDLARAILRHAGRSGGSSTSDHEGWQ
jgi:hypothetical protein